MFLTTIAKRNDGTHWAIRLTSADKVNLEGDELDGVPGDSVQLDSVLDIAERELALRLHHDGGYDGPVTHAGDCRFVINLRDKPAVKLSADPHIKMGEAMRELMKENGADEAVISAPGNVGYGIAMSCLPGISTDSPYGKFMRAICNGESWAVLCWVGEEPPAMPGDRDAETVCDAEYLVLSGSEADAAAQKAAEAKADELVSSLDPIAVSYFDQERFVIDTRSEEQGGTGALLACDGVQHQVELDGEGLTFFVYKTA